MRLIFMGMSGLLSAAPLATLLQAGHSVSAVLLAAPWRGATWRPLPPPAHPAGSVPLPTPSPTILQLSWQHQIPLYESGDLNAEQTIEGLRRLAPDVVLVSCFPYRVPPRLLHLPTHGFLNLHPSRLPHYRGPYPLFWQLRDGLDEIGLTVHAMDEGLDSGPIALQSSVALADGLSPRQIEQRAGEQGGLLFVEALRRLAEGRLPSRPQIGPGSQQGTPGPEAFHLDRRWTARHAFNFMRGTADWGHPYTLHDAGRQWLLRRALAYDPQAVQTPFVTRNGEVLRIRFSHGVLEAT